MAHIAQGTHEHVHDSRNDEIVVYVNGELKPRAAAVVSVFDSGFVLGDGVWEGPDEVTANLARYGFSPGDVETQYAADVRFLGQHHTVTVALDDAWVHDTAALLAGIDTRFHALHGRMYGPRTHDSSLEVVTLRARGTVAVTSPRLSALETAGDGAAHGTRPVRFDRTTATTALYDRASLAAGQQLTGPAIIEEWANTTVVPPGWQASVDQLGHLHLTPATTKGADR